MNIQRFQAPSMRNAILDVRRRLGAEAFILHSRAVEGGVEVVAAADYDPALFEALGRSGDAVQGPLTDIAVDELEARAAAGAGVAPGAAPNAEQPAPGAASAPGATPGGAGLYDRFGRAEAAQAPARPAPTDGPATARPGKEPGRRGAASSRQQALRASERLDDVGAELRSLRSLVEQQLSGLAWQDLVRRHPQRAAVLRRLLAYGLTPDLAKEVVEALQPAPDGAGLWTAALAELARRIPRGADDIVSRGGVVALVGPTGVGKTTTIAKLAGACTLRHGPGSVGLVTTDDYRLGAHEQLQAFGRILDIPVRPARDAAAVRNAVESFAGRELVLVDTEGAGDHVQRQCALLGALDGSGRTVRVYLLLGANAQRASLMRTVAAFPRERLHGCIITKLDECGSLGEVLSTVVASALPLGYVSDGPQVPDDLHPANVPELVRRGDTLVPDEDAMGDELMGLTFGRLVAAANG